MLIDRVAAELAADTGQEWREAARRIAAESEAVAILFYGSVLRSGNIADLADMYVLTAGPARGGPLRRAASALLWPDVGYRRIDVGGGTTVRVKIATMPLDTFARAARGELVDTTVWTRFCQPARLVWAADARHRDRAVTAVAAAVTTASRFAALLGPATAPAEAYWRALFAHTYRTELRVERTGRGDEIVSHAAPRYAALLPLAWDAGGVPYDATGETLSPRLPVAARAALRGIWRRRVLTGRAHNAARLVKAAFTFDDATDYALDKIERHTGIRIPATPWRRRHPVLAAPGVLWRVFRAARA